MKFEKLEYSHRESLAQILRARNSFLSEYSFTNAYLFRNPHNYEVAVTNNCTFLRGVTYDGTTYLMPVCPIEIIPLETMIEMAKTVDCIFPIQQEWLSYFPTNLFEYKYLDGDSDYMYLTEHLATLAGRKLSKKRNLLKQYKTLYKSDDYNIDLSRVDDCKYILDMWCKELGHEHNDTDCAETTEALDKLTEFNLRGMIFYADDKPAGFVLGEELNDETFALHFAKGSREYKGIYQYMYNTFTLAIMDEYKYINFEQDLGKDSLRQAKSTYYPNEMRIKYRVSLKK